MRTRDDDVPVAKVQDSRFTRIEVAVVITGHTVVGQADIAGREPGGDRAALDDIGEGGRGAIGRHRAASA
jgi:hypothetical protein